jgi:4-hydroxy-4-methyl-2-oxoglutarate aldolase
MTVENRDLTGAPRLAWGMELDAASRAATEAGTATLHEAAGQRGVLPASIKPLHPDWSVCGPALTVSCAPFDNLWIHRALYVAQPGDVLVIACSGAHEGGYWGELMTHAARARGIAGAVLDAGARDSAVLTTLGLPVFARCISIRGTSKDPTSHGSIGEPITVGDVVVHSGDLVAGDRDGVVVIPAADAAATLHRAAERLTKEAAIIVALQGGASTLDLLGLSGNAG